MIILWLKMKWDDINDSRYVEKKLIYTYCHCIGWNLLYSWLETWSKLYKRAVLSLSENNQTGHQWMMRYCILEKEKCILDKVLYIYCTMCLFSLILYNYILIVFSLKPLSSLTKCVRINRACFPPNLNYRNATNKNTKIDKVGNWTLNLPDIKKAAPITDISTRLNIHIDVN